MTYICSAKTLKNNKSMEIIEVKKYKNKVEFILKSYNGKYKVELTNRFIVCLRNSRWDFVKNEILHYFIQHGQKGCVCGSGVDFYSVKGRKYIIHPSNIFVWDLSFVFPDVEFEDNKDSITDEVINTSISNEIKEWGVKID